MGALEQVESLFKAYLAAPIVIISYIAYKIWFVYDVSGDGAYWLHVQEHFRQLSGFDLFTASRTVTVHVALAQVLTPDAVRQFAAFRNRMFDLLMGSEVAVNKVTSLALKSVLLRLGFRDRSVAGSHVLLDRPDADAVVLLRPYREEEIIDPVNLLGLRRILDEKGVIAKERFDDLLQHHSLAG